MMKRMSFVVVLISVFLMLSQNAGAIPTSTNDLWDVSQATVVTAHSDVHHISHIANMFGYNYDGGYNEGGNTLFRDNQYAGYSHWVEWQTADPIWVNSFNLVAAHDGANTNYRAFSTFNLYYWTAQSWELLYSYDASNPYGGGETYTQEYQLELFDTFSTVFSQNFRAEFVQYSSDGYGLATGPRIYELDGYYTIPEPCSIGLTVLGFLALARHPKKEK